MLLTIIIFSLKGLAQEVAKCDLKDRFSVDIGFGLQDMKMEVYNDYLSSKDHIGNLEESYPPIDYGYMASISINYSALKSRDLLTSFRYSYTWAITSGTYNMNGDASQLWYADEMVMANLFSLGIGYRIFNTQKIDLNMIAGPSYVKAYIANRSRTTGYQQDDYYYMPGSTWGFFLETNVNYNFWKRFFVNFSIGYNEANVKEMKNLSGTQLMYQSHDISGYTVENGYPRKNFELDFSGMYGKFGIGYLIY